jgi:hypothetical protein
MNSMQAAGKQNYWVVEIVGKVTKTDLSCT